MTSKNPAPTATHPVEDRRVQPDGPLSGEVKRGGDTQEVSRLRYDAHLAYLDGRMKRAKELNRKADKLARLS